MTETARRRVDEALERARAWNPRTNAFTLLLEDEAGIEADAVDDEGRAGPLAGMPVAIKAQFDVRGHPTTGCSAAIGAEPATRDAALVERLRAAGGVVIGKTAMHELAAGVTGLESACGPTRNPWDPTRMTGGSSGGSAAAVASGVVPLSIVSDTGGSARIPASFCGVWGMKATKGRLPLDGMMPLAPEMDGAGLIGGSVGALNAGWRALGVPIDDAPPPRRVGVLRGGRWERCHAQVRGALDDAIRRLASDVDLVDIEGSELDDVHHVWNRIAWPSFAETYPDLVGHDSIGRGTAAVLRWGLDHRDERPDALARAEGVRAWFADVFGTVDLLLAAATPYAAPNLDAETVDLGDGTTMDAQRGGPAWFTTAANVAGLPALSVPFARSSDGLPIGLQLIGPADREDALLRGGALLVPDGAERPPQP